MQMTIASTISGRMIVVEGTAEQRQGTAVKEPWWETPCLCGRERALLMRRDLYVIVDRRAADLRHMLHQILPPLLSPPLLTSNGTEQPAPFLGAHQNLAPPNFSSPVI